MKSARNQTIQTSSQNKNGKASKQQITIRLDAVTIGYFKKLAEELNMPYQHLIDLYLKDCVENSMRPQISWTPRSVSNS